MTHHVPGSLDDLGLCSIMLFEIFTSPPFHWVRISPGSFDVGHGNGICFVLTVDGANVLPVDLGRGHVVALANGR